MFSVAIVCLALWVGSAGEAPRVEEREVEFDSGGVTLAATLLVPRATAKAPAVVLVHGSGDSDRSNPWTKAYADALAERGFVVLHPDKRGCGKSQGDWKTASFDVLADDAARGIEFLRARSEVDATRVGLIGFSQGVHVAPVCAARKGVADFVVCVSGSVVPLLEQVIDEIALQASREGAPLSPQQRRTVETLHGQALECARSSKGWDELSREIERASASPAVASAVQGLRAPRDHWVWKWIAAVGDFDPLPAWKQVEVPMLFVYGGRDERVDAAKSVQRLRAGFAGTERNWSVIELALNGHALFRDDVLDFVARWVRDRGAK